MGKQCNRIFCCGNLIGQCPDHLLISKRNDIMLGLEMIGNNHIFLNKEKVEELIKILQERVKELNG